ncbi:hypothetical protein LTR06_011069 [Exophiala xenobiotica]|nr:hypothetical protein LTR06_011069 [Exophiala xenobiotica]
MASVPNHETKLPEYEAIRPKQVISLGTRMAEGRMGTAVEPAYLGLFDSAEEEATAVGSIDLYDKELGPEEDVPVTKTKVEHEADDSSEGKDRSDGHDEEEDIDLGGGRHDHDGREHGDADGIRPIARNPKGGTSQKLQLRQTPHDKGNSELGRFLQPSISLEGVVLENYGPFVRQCVYLTLSTAPTPKDVQCMPTIELNATYDPCSLKSSAAIPQNDTSTFSIGSPFFLTIFRPTIPSSFASIILDRWRGGDYEKTYKGFDRVAQDH